MSLFTRTVSFCQIGDSPTSGLLKRSHHLASKVFLDMVKKTLAFISEMGVASRPVQGTGIFVMLLTGVSREFPGGMSRFCAWGKPQETFFMPGGTLTHSLKKTT
jgi:hypothetical protein